MGGGGEEGKESIGGMREGEGKGSKVKMGGEEGRAVRQ